MPVGQVHRVCGPTENTKDQTGNRATHRLQVTATAATANGNNGEEGERLFTGKKAQHRQLPQDIASAKLQTFISLCSKKMKKNVLAYHNKTCISHSTVKTTVNHQLNSHHQFLIPGSCCSSFLADSLGIKARRCQQNSNLRRETPVVF